jgi:hypothetical protein
MNNEVWIAHNKEILHSIKTIHINVDKKYQVLEFVKEFCKQNASEVLGDFGDSCLSFLKNIDVKHPEFTSFFYNLIGEKAIDEVLELFEANKFFKRKNFKLINLRIKYLLENFRKDKIMLNGKTLGNPMHTNIHTRFIPKSNIWSCRDNKKSQHIQASKGLISFTPEMTDNLFSCYHHNSDKTQELRLELERRRKIFVNMNCSYMIAEIDSAIEKLNNEIMLKNFGFRRITLNNVGSLLKSIYQDDRKILINPITSSYLSTLNIESDVLKFVKVCDEFPLFHFEYPVFDHYGIVGCQESGLNIIVGERDTQTYFLGYHNV